MTLSRGHVRARKRPRRSVGTRAVRAAWARACRLGANDLAIAVVCVKLCPLKPSFEGEDDMPAAKKPTTRTPDRKSTRLNSSHTVISYAVFCLKKKKHK